MKSDSTSGLSRQNLGREVAAVYCVQLFLVIALVQIDRRLSLGGNLHAFVGIVFILLPVLVLDRRGRPYGRYGVAWGKPLADLPWVLAAMAVAFPPIILGAPAVWGIGNAAWEFALPKGYPGAAFAQLVVVSLPEEFFYRGYVMGRLDDIFPPRFKLLGAKVGWSLPIQAALFAAGHFLVDGNPSRLAVFFPALAFGWLRSSRGTIVAPVLFHAASNIFMELFRAGYGLV